MKTTFVATAIFWTFFLGWPGLNSSTTVLADSAFSSYSPDIPWIQEMAFLDDFAIFLKQNPDTLGYIAFYVGEKDSINKIRIHVNKSKKHLIKQLKVDPSRLIVVYGGKLRNSSIVLQPSPRNQPPPKFVLDSKT